MLVTWQRRRYEQVEVLFWHSCCIVVVMSEDTKDLVGSSEHDKVGPDFFGYYTRSVIELLSQEEDFPSSASQFSEQSQSKCVKVRGKDMIEHSYGTSGTLFGGSIGTGISDMKKERLKSLLKQGVNILSPEAEEMLEPVIAISQLRSQIKSKKCSSSSKGASPDVDARNNPSKRPKRSSPLSSTSLPELSMRDNPESTREVDDELQFLIENDRLQVEETVKKYSNEFSATLGHMEQQLEKLLYTVISTCRPMTLPEKHKLGKMIQNLPPKNLHRVVEMIQHRNTGYANSSDEIHVDLEKESNVTLWRLYYYVEAVEKARKLAK